MYKVTLAMPIYNVEKYIERALLSALNQTFDSIEYILVDDKGKDESIHIAKEIIKKHPRYNDVRIIEHTENRGLGAVRNTALDNACGEYIFFMDSDDEITPDCIAMLYDAMMKTQVAFIQGSHVSNRSEYLNRNPNNRKITIGDDNFAVAKSYFCKKYNVAPFTCNKLYSLDFLKKNNVRCSKLVKNVEDRLFSFQVILNARSCILLNDISYIYHKDNDSSFTINEINGLASESVMNDYQNIIRTKYEDLQNYVDKDFYTQAILENYLLAMRFAKIIDSSTIIPQEVKRQTVQTFKALPAIEINKIPKIKNRLHLLSIICLNILPSISIKTFIIKAYDKILRTYFTGKL